MTRPLTSPEVEALVALAKKWRSEADGEHYSQQAELVRNCAAELEAALSRPTGPAAPEATKIDSESPRTDASTAPRYARTRRTAATLVRCVDASRGAAARPEQET